MRNNLVVPRLITHVLRAENVVARHRHCGMGLLIRMCSNGFSVENLCSFASFCDIYAQQSRCASLENTMYTAFHISIFLQSTKTSCVLMCIVKGVHGCKAYAHLRPPLCACAHRACAWHAQSCYAVLDVWNHITSVFVLSHGHAWYACS